MIALKSFSNSIAGNIKEGQKLSDRVLRVLDVKALLNAGFIGEEKNETISDGINIDDNVSFSSIDIQKTKTKKEVKK